MRVVVGVVVEGKGGGGGGGKGASLECFVWCFKSQVMI